MSEKKKIKSVLEHDINKIAGTMDEYKGLSQEEVIRKSIEDFYGKDNVEWMLIYHKASGIVSEKGDDITFTNPDFEIFRELFFTVEIKYNKKLVFWCYNGELRTFVQEKEWIDKLNDLYEV